jgi:hypothetical protein
LHVCERFLQRLFLLLKISQGLKHLLLELVYLLLVNEFAIQVLRRHLLFRYFELADFFLEVCSLLLEFGVLIAEDLKLMVFDDVHRGVLFIAVIVVNLQKVNNDIARLLCSI